MKKNEREKNDLKSRCSCLSSGAANYIGCFQDTTYEDVAVNGLSVDPPVKKCIEFCLSESK